MIHVSRRRFGAIFSAGLTGLAGVRYANATGRSHQIAIKAFAFDPPELVARPGDVIEWHNFDLAPHTATEIEGGWDSGELVRGAFWAFVVDTPGRHSYFCTFHPHMKGDVFVATGQGT